MPLFGKKGGASMAMGKGISKGARACPNCGQNYHKWAKKMRQECVWTCQGCGCQFNAPMPEIKMGGGGCG